MGCENGACGGAGELDEKGPVRLTQLSSKAG